jgi:parvulin-like peptidyl-prolyl isomerase
MNHLLAALVITSSPLLVGAADAPGAGDGEKTYVYVTGEDGKAIRADLFADTTALLPVARVDSEVITVEQLTAALGSAHQGLTSEVKAGHKDFSPVLERMIDARLVILEGRDMGLADLPEVKQAVAEYREQALMQALQAKATAGARADPAEVQRLYDDAVKEWKLQSILFSRPEDAKAFVAAVKGGKPFDVAAKQAVAEKKAKGGNPAEFVPADRMLPAVVGAVSSLRKGQVSAPFQVKEGYAVVRLEDVRHPAGNAKARAEAEKIATANASQRALKTYYAGLVKKYVVIDEKLLKRVNFEAKKPGRAALEKDPRVLARIRGEPSITVGDLAKQVFGQFYHGAENALKEKKVNRQKGPTLDGMISKRIVPKEAKALGLDQTPEFQRAVAEFADRTVFTSFVEKAILPDVKVTEQEQRKYYEQHKADEFTLAAFYKLENLSFTNVKAAQASLDKLRSGTDFKWLRQNAEGQVPEAERVIKVEGTTVSAKTMPADLAKLLAGSKAGDYRLYPSEKSQYHVIRVVDATPPEVEPFEQAKGAIEKRLYAENVNRAIKEYADKLRKSHTVKVYITKIGS